MGKELAFDGFGQLGALDAEAKEGLKEKIDGDTNIGLLHLRDAGLAGLEPRGQLNLGEMKLLTPFFEGST